MIAFPKDIITVCGFRPIYQGVLARHTFAGKVHQNSACYPAGRSELVNVYRIGDESNYVF